MYPVMLSRSMEEWQFVAACGRMVASGDKEAGIEPASAAKRSKRPRERFLFRFFYMRCNCKILYLV
jgi:hypothetical protein